MIKARATLWQPEPHDLHSCGMARLSTSSTAGPSPAVGTHVQLGLPARSDVHHRHRRLLHPQGIEGQGFYSTHVVPIIENTARECELTDRLRAAIQAYPQANAVLVRRHGAHHALASGRGSLLVLLLVASRAAAAVRCTGGGWTQLTGPEEEERARWLARGAGRSSRCARQCRPVPRSRSRAWRTSTGSLAGHFSRRCTSPGAASCACRRVRVGQGLDPGQDSVRVLRLPLPGRRRDAQAGP